MNFFNHIFKRHAPIAFTILSVLVFVTLIKVFAAGPFAPGTELDPNCLPTDVGCNVSAPVSSPGGSDKQIQFNDSNSFNGDGGLVWNNSLKSFRAGQSGNSATGDSSIALGDGSNASAYASFAGGAGSQASGQYSFAYGSSSIAENDRAIAMGDSADSSGSGSVALGTSATASGDDSIALGNNAHAVGNQAVAGGNQAYANGRQSTSFGSLTNANAYGEVVLGTHNDVSGYTPSSSSWVATDRIFTVGNGDPAGAASNALVILKNGKVGIGTSSPTYQLETFGHGATTGIKVSNDGFYTGVPNPGSIANSIVLNTRGLNITNGATLSGSYQSDLGIGVAVSSANTAVSFSNTGAGPALLVESGNVGIGTSSPAFDLSIGTTSEGSSSSPRAISLGSSYSNAANAHAKLRLYYDGTNTYGFGVSSGQIDYMISAGTHAFYSGSSEIAAIVGGGTAPNPLLIGDALGYRGISLNGTLNGTDYNFISSSSDPDLFINVPSGKKIHFRNGNTENVVINSAGDVGIGTTSPSVPLQVNGASSAAGNSGTLANSGAIFAIDPLSKNAMAFGVNGGAGWIQNYSPTDLGADYGPINLNPLFGNVGIGISSYAPAYKLDVAGGDINTDGVYRAGGTAGVGDGSTCLYDASDNVHIAIKGGIIVDYATGPCV